MVDPISSYRRRKDDMSDVYALKQPHPDGSEWIQEFDSLAEAVQYRSHSGGVLVRRQPLPGQPGLWWVEVEPVMPDGFLKRLTEGSGTEEDVEYAKAQAAFDYRADRTT